MRTASIQEVLSSIEAHALESPGGAIAFDGDGTLWSGDIGEDFFEALLTRGPLTPVASAALAREAESGGIDAGGDGVSVARRIHAAYLAGTFSEERACEIMAWAFAGWTKPDVDAFALRVLKDVGLASRLHGESVAIVEWARARNLPVYLVSASPRAIVEQAAKLVRIDLACVVSATEQCDAKGIVEAAVVRPIPYGPGKVSHLQGKLKKRVLYAAFGDNAFDVPMLLHAKTPVAIRPKARLVSRAAEVPGLVTLERRDATPGIE